MIGRRSSRRKAAVSLESLDERVVPSMFGVQAHANAAEMAQVRLQMSEGLRAQLQAHQNLSFAARLQNFERLHPNAAARFHPMAPNTHLFFGTPPGSSSGQSKSTPSVAAPLVAVPRPHPSVSNPTPNAAHTLPANAGQILNTIYQEYQAYLANGGSGSFKSSESFMIVISGNNVGINAHGNGSGNFSAYVTALKDLGMQVQASDAKTETVVGLIPINELPDAANLPQTLSLSPLYKPILM